MVEVVFQKGVRTLKIRRILLISPNPTGGAGRYKPLFPPLALMQLKALTPRDIQVKIVDESVKPIDFDNPADLVGISVTMSAVRPRANQIAQEFHKKGISVVYGGVDPTMSPQECLAEADFVFCGEAEGGWTEFLALLKQDKAPRVFHAQDFPDLSNIPSPCREDFKPEDYVFYNIVQTGRGCPNNCRFCSVPAFSGHKLRFRPIEHTIAEIKTLPKGVVIFSNDNLWANFDYAEKLFKALIPLRLYWFAQHDTRVEKRPALVKLAAKSGFVTSFVGFESFNLDSLKEAGKTFNRTENYRKLMRLLHQHGVVVIPAMIFGFDTDTKQSFETCFRQLNRMKADAPQFSVLTPLPGTAFYDEVKKENRLITSDLSQYNGTKAVFRPKFLSPIELEIGVRRMYQRYYSLGILWRLISDPWFWRHPFRRLIIFRILVKHFKPRIWAWLKREYRPRK